MEEEDDAVLAGTSLTRATVVSMDERQFELCVQAAVDSLPDELRSRMSNVAVVIDDDAR